MIAANGLDEFVFVPLGGAGEIGMNLNLYGYGPPGRERWLMVDLGVTFAREVMPGVDVILPDPIFIEERRDRLDGLVLTHAHEDHLGAVHHLWPRLRCPVYGTAFALAVLRRKLAEVGLEDDVPITEVPLGSRFRIGPFDLELVTLTHSIPEPNAVAVRTPAGTVLHTGDWKLDPDPVVGSISDEDRLRAIGDDGVLALVCDSTNVFEPGASGSEGALSQSLSDIIERCRGRVLVTCFATNVARLMTVATAAAKAGRHVVACGRSLKQIADAARATGYLTDVAPFLDEAEGAYLPRDRTLILCSGSQGEPRAALARIVNGDHPQLHLERGDTVIFSSRTIPGNEARISRLYNTLVREGVEFVTARDAFVHVSGHPARDELARMYALVRPDIVVPVHGELRHMAEHQGLAEQCGVGTTVVVENGDLTRLSPEPVGIVDHVPTGRLSVEGNRLVPMDGNLVRERNRAIYNGTAVVTIVLNGKGGLAGDPQISTFGLLETGEDGMGEVVGHAIATAIDGLGQRTYKDDDVVRETVRLAVRRAFHDGVGKKPLTQVHLVRITE